MKHLIRDNRIVSSGLPSHFTRPNGESFWGGYETMVDIHEEDGWVNEVVPVYDQETQTIGSIYYDEASNVVTYHVVDLTVDVESYRQSILDDLKQLRVEISNIILQVDQLNDGVPSDLKSFLPNIKGLYAYAKMEIDALDETNIRQYILRGPQVEGLLSTLNSFL